MSTSGVRAKARGTQVEWQAQETKKILSFPALCHFSYASRPQGLLSPRDDTIVRRTCATAFWTSSTVTRRAVLPARIRVPAQEVRQGSPWSAHRRTASERPLMRERRHAVRIAAGSLRKVGHPFGASPSPLS